MLVLDGKDTCELRALSFILAQVGHASACSGG